MYTLSCASFCIRAVFYCSIKNLKNSLAFFFCILFVFSFPVSAEPGIATVEQTVGNQAPVVVSSGSSSNASDSHYRQWGSLVPKEQAPAIYQTLEEIRSKLHEGLVEYVHERGNWRQNPNLTSKIHVVDSKFENAFIVHPATNTVEAEYPYDIYVTTALLDRFLPEDLGSATTAEKERAVKRLIGVIGHELGHAANDFVETVYRHREGGSQAREYKADIEGAEIVRRAGYPPVSVYEALSELSEPPSSGRALKRGVIAWLSTHPGTRNRLSAQRHFLTLDRYNRGENEPRALPQISSGAQGERTGFNYPAGRFSDLSEKSIEDLIAFIEKHEIEKTTLKGGSTEWENVSLDIAHHLRTLDERLLEVDPNSVPENQVERIARIQSRLVRSAIDYKNYYPYHPTNERVARSPVDALHPEPEAEVIARVPLYSSQKYLDYVRNGLASLNVSDARSSGFGDWESDSYKTVKNHLPESQVYPTLGKFIRQIVGTAIIDGKSGAAIDGWMEALPLNDRLQLSAHIWENIYPKLSPTDRFFFLYDMAEGWQGSLEHRYFPLTTHSVEGGLTREGEREQQAELRNVHEELYSDSVSEEAKKARRSIAEGIWANRGELAVAELLFPIASDRIDWSFVYRELGIDPKQGDNEIREAVKQFSSTPEYAELLQGRRDSDINRKQDAPTLGPSPSPDGSTRARNLSWATMELLPHLNGEHNSTLRADPELAQEARKGPAYQLYQIHPDSFRQRYAEALTATMGTCERCAASLKAFDDVHVDVIEKVLGFRPENVKGFPRPYDLIARSIDRSSLSADKKREWLARVFIGQQESGQRRGSIPWETTDGALQAAKILLKHGVVETGTDLFATYLEYPEGVDRARRDRQFMPWGERVKGYKNLEPLLHDDLNRIARLPEGEREAELKWFMREIFDYFNDTKSGAPGRNDKVRDASFKRIVEHTLEVLEQCSCDPETKFKYFMSMTQHAATAKSDAFFEQHFLENHEFRNYEVNLKYDLNIALMDDPRFLSDSLRTRVALSIL